ncbi:uncharacterized protein [Typha angustifolia]|uniref:uncharacterized protein isoform X2 n=1 Tax=Typha angustifolia TaxID=59011 RepID=UPI003C2D501D
MTSRAPFTILYEMSLGGLVTTKERSSLSCSNLKVSLAKSTKAMPTSSAKSTTLAERHIRVSDMQQQLSRLQEELRMEREEKSRALEELKELKNLTASSSRDKILEKEVEKAKASERKMLESLLSVTKKFQQTKLSLEEAKLEITSLQERSSRDLENHLDDEDKIRVLRNELQLAIEGEERSKKAMDELAITLREVITESKQVKGRLSVTQSEFKNAREEAESSKSLLKSMEEKFSLVSQESEKLKLEVEESFAIWNEKEKGFINCMKISEEEINKAKQENTKLIESQRVIREENSKLRAILKQTVNEAIVMREELEITRNENSQLKDLVSVKEHALQSIKQEFECLKVSEAAALGSLREMKSLLAAMSSIDSSKPGSLSETGSILEPRESLTMRILPLDQQKVENRRIQNGRRHSIGEPAKLKGSMFDSAGSSQRKERAFASFSNVSEMNVASSIYNNDLEYESDRIDATPFSYMKQKRNTPILRKFADMFRIRSFHKFNYSSLVS